MTRTNETLRRFRLADKRGLTRRDLQVIAGPHFQRTLDRLRRRGCVFAEHRSRFSPRTFRWVLQAEIPAVPEPAGPPELDMDLDEILFGAQPQLPLDVEERVR